jgi:lysozyme family protein
MADFQKAVELVLAHEGGYEPPGTDDPGGETNFGISKRAYPDLDIRSITRQQATDIYHRDYWNPLYDLIKPQELANALLDFGVNSGTTHSVSCLQRVLGRIVAGPVAIDGVFGKQTLEFLNEAVALDQDKVLRDFQHSRILFYIGLTKPKDLSDWIYRTLDV